MKPAKERKKERKKKEKKRNKKMLNPNFFFQFSLSRVYENNR